MLITKFCISCASNEIGNDKATSVCSDRQTTNGGNDNISPRPSSYTSLVQRVRQSSRYNYCGALGRAGTVVMWQNRIDRLLGVFSPYIPTNIYIYISILGTLWLTIIIDNSRFNVPYIPTFYKWGINIVTIATSYSYIIFYK